MARRLALWSLALAAVLAFTVIQLRARRPAPPARPVSVARRIAPPDRFDDPGRLAPDVRFLRAAGDIRHVLTGAVPAAAQARFDAGRWRVTLDGREVGTLSEFPGFPELRATLTAWAVTLGARESLAAHGAATAGVEVAAIEAETAKLHALRAAHFADAAWQAGRRDPAVAVAGARALAWLTAECTDLVSAGDAIGARALAWNAIATAVDSLAPQRETVLLAAALGYPADAWAGAVSLPALDPIRLYVRREDATLDDFAAGHRDAAEARWLSMLRWAERRDLEHWTAAADRGLRADPTLALPILGNAFAVGAFEADMPSGMAVLGAVAEDLRLHALLASPSIADQDRPLAETVQSFELLLSAMPDDADGAFLDRDVLAAWYRAAFYGSLLVVGEHLRDKLSSIEDMKAFAHDLGNGENSTGAGGEFQRWFAHECDIKVGRTVRADLREDLLHMPHFGAATALRTYAAIEENTHFGDAFLPWSAHTLQARLDSRPEHLWRWGGIVSGGLSDLVRGERIAAAAVAASHPRDTFRRGWWASFQGDRRALDAMLAEQPENPMDLVELLRQAGRAFPGDSLRLDARWDQLIADDADDWRVIRPYALVLDARHADDRIRKICGAWLARPDRSLRPFDEIGARTYFGRACLRQGRYAEGLEAVLPVVGSWQGDAMATAAELMDRAGRSAAAETLAAQLWDRYPDNEPSQALFVDLLWRHGRHGLAAGVLADAPQKLSTEGWRRTLGPRFARLEREQPGEARRALDSLAAHHLDDWPRLGGLIAALADCGRHSAALELWPRIHGDRGAGQQLDAKLFVEACANARAAGGDSAAAAWLASQLGTRDAGPMLYLHLYAYAQRQPAMLWQLPLAGAPADIEYEWLLRAAASVRDSFTADDAALQAHFLPLGGDDAHREGRLVLGFDPPDSAGAIGGDAKRKSEIAYFLGLRAQGDGDYPAAAEWYARCIDAGFANNGEHQWALEQLARWWGRHTSLRRIAEQDGFGRNKPAPVPAPKSPQPNDQTALAR